MADAQLDRIEAKVDEALGTLALHSQTLYGVHGRGGLVDEARHWSVIEKHLSELVDAKRTPSAPEAMISMRNLWAAVGAIAAVASVGTALLLGVVA